MIDTNDRKDKHPKLSTRGEAALALARLGWPVLPLHWATHTGEPPCSCGGKDCKVGKHPYARNGFARNGLHDATTDQGSLRRWWSRHPDLNVAIATGSRAGIVVLDVDPRHGGDAALLELERDHGPLPATVVATSGGGGKHYYFRHVQGIGSSANKLAGGLDVRGDGGYIIAPPSNHASGGAYAWDSDCSPWDREPAALPEWLLAMLTGSPPSSAPATAPGARLSEGGRNTWLMSRAGTLRSRGFTPAAIEAALFAENREQCDPPLPESEVRAVARSVQRYEPGPAGIAGAIEWIGCGDIFKPLPPTRWICESLQISPGRPSMLAGYGSSGKTLFAMALNLAMASGTLVWGHFPSVQGVVRHFDHEQGRHATLKRYQRLAVGMGVDAAATDGRLFVSVFPKIALNLPDAVDAYARECEGAELAVIDALRGATPGEDENDSKIRVCLDNLTQVSERTGCAFLVLHHSPKGSLSGDSRDNRSTPRGSSAIFDACGCVYTLKSADGGLVVVSQAKPPAEAAGGKVPDFGLRIEDVRQGDDPVGGVRVVHTDLDAASIGERLQGFERDRQKVLNVIATKPGCTKREVRAGAGLQAARTDEMLADLLEDCTVENRGTATAYKLHVVARALDA